MRSKRGKICIKSANYKLIVIRSIEKNLKYDIIFVSLKRSIENGENSNCY